MDRYVYERFGSRKGFVLFLAHWFLAKVGAYRRFTGSRSYQRLVFVCSGNICRSPLAEVYARSLGKEAVSCGLNCSDGHPANHRAREFAREQGLSLDSHKTINVKDFEFRDTDLIIVMEPSHITLFQEKMGSDYRLVLAGSYCKKPHPYIHDPFNCCDEFFIHCERRVMEAVRGICG